MALTYASESAPSFLTKMLSLFIALGVFIFSRVVSAAPQAQVINCRQFSGHPADEPDMRCQEMPDYPTDMSGIQFDLYHYTTNWNPTTNNLLTLGLMPTAASQVLDQYRQWCQDSSITMMLANSLPDRGKNAGAVTESSDDGSKCYVRVLKPQPFMKGFVTILMEQTIAHELYHCTQKCVRPQTVVDQPWTTWFVTPYPWHLIPQKIRN